MRIRTKNWVPYKVYERSMVRGLLTMVIKYKWYKVRMPVEMLIDICVCYTDVCQLVVQILSINRLKIASFTRRNSDV